jgi:hypothetical protein
VPLNEVTRYVSYALALVVRQLGGVQHVPRTNRFSQFSRLFKNQSTLEVVVDIKQDYKIWVLVKKDSYGLRDPFANEKYLGWRNLSLVTIFMTLGFEAETSQAIKSTKRKRISNEEELRE